MGNESIVCVGIPIGGDFGDVPLVLYWKCLSCFHCSGSQCCSLYVRLYAYRGGLLAASRWDASSVLWLLEVGFSACYDILCCI